HSGCSFHVTCGTEPFANAHSSSTSIAVAKGMPTSMQRRKLSMSWRLNQKTFDGWSFGNRPLYLKRLPCARSTYQRSSKAPKNRRMAASLAASSFEVQPQDKVRIVSASGSTKAHQAKAVTRNSAFHGNR